MITTRSFYGLNPVWVIVKQAYIKRNNAWVPVKQAHVKYNGIWNQVYSENISPPVETAHPYWRYSLDPEFTVNDNNQNDGLASDLYFTFWSTNNSGTYAINSGSSRINVNDIETTPVPAVPPTAGYYVYTEETRDILCNFTNGSNSVVTFPNPGVKPLTRTGVNNVSVPWTIRAFGYTRSGSTITDLTTDNSSIQVFTMNQTAQQNGSAIIANLSRTYASSYIPPTSGSDAYYTHTGICRMLSNYEVNVSPGQVYRLLSSAISGSISAENRWGMIIYTSPTAGQAGPFGTGAQVNVSNTFGNTTSQTFDFTIPSGHYYLRVGLFVWHNSTTSTNSPPTLPIWGRFDYLRLRRIS